ncbi:hypothetical protein [Streptomyces rochei]|uniref:hypothetical protein n=1 Tax=Streptomyces rochei TaxID=1928 RepID=UPI0013B5D07C|nr:hypothetical protein [Streptomyces rochei]NEC72934.1 hypothetical protein [Streptomyces rochei]
MAVEMTEEYASAMVTVLPVIMLVALVEFNNANAAYRNTQLEYTQALLQAVRNGEIEPIPPSKWSRRAREAAYMYWYAIVGLHIYAESLLIQWLASTERGPDPGTAEFVRAVGAWGFLTVICGFVINVWLTRKQRIAEVMRLEALVRQERAVRAAQAPVLRVPPGSDQAP